MNSGPVICPKCKKEPRVVVSMVGSYVRCPWCDFSTYMQSTKEDAVKLWNKLAKELNMEKDNIINIKMAEIYPHPDNPRKDLGDLTKLSKSIKANGIMQNLTVIPGHKMTDEEWLELERKYKENQSEELRNVMNARWMDSGYTLIIGHRRHAAAKEAGLAELPCRIVKDLSYREQVAIMLEENMQRNDLTILEQAQGFQMMLDLGETEDSIAEKTGFSKTTIKRRLNIAKLDPELVKKKTDDTSFQLSLSDLYALEQIEDIETRNKVLNDASNHDQVIWKAKRAAEEEKRTKRQDKLIPILEGLGVKKASKKIEIAIHSSKWKTVKEFDLNKNIPDNVSLKGKELYWLRYCGYIRVIKKNDQKEAKKSKYELQREKIDKDKKEINSKAKQAYNQMCDFTRKFVTGKLSAVREQQWHLLAVWEMMTERECGVSLSRISAVLLDKKNSWDITEEEKKAVGKDIEKMKLFQQMLCCFMYDLPTDLADYNGYYYQTRGKKMTKAYDFLSQFGFTFDSEEYEQILDGTHTLYRVKEEAKND